MKMHSLHTAILLIGIASAGLACADIFKFTDKNGYVVLSNVPSNNHYTLVLQTPEEDTKIVNNSLIIKARPYAGIVEEAARANKIDEALLHAIIAIESGYDPLAVSVKGASGLMQLMPQTARRYGVANRYDPSENVRGGARYLKYLLQVFNNDLRLALAAYNAGESTVARFGNKMPPYRQTTGYVDKVMRLYDKNLAAFR